MKEQEQDRLPVSEKSNKGENKRSNRASRGHSQLKSSSENFESLKCKAPIKSVLKKKHCFACPQPQVTNSIFLNQICYNTVPFTRTGHW